jgi:hypothetical protein
MVSFQSYRLSAFIAFFLAVFCTNVFFTATAYAHHPTVTSVCDSNYNQNSRSWKICQKDVTAYSYVVEYRLSGSNDSYFTAPLAFNECVTVQFSIQPGQTDSLIARGIYQSFVYSWVGPIASNYFEAQRDQCGVCGGDNSTCKDCKGVVNGTAKIDVCGVCDGNGLSCLGCDGLPNSGKIIDACNICGGDNSTCKDCMGIVNGAAVIDECGVCGGDNSTCKDCKGVPNGTSKVDVCGVCDGDGKSCLGCDGLPKSGKVVDACGVCGGDSSSCKDCAGIPNGGGKIDQCGVCNGKDNTCLDCSGVPNGGKKVDACGVCGGSATDPNFCIINNPCPNGKIDKCGVCNGNDACLDCAGIPNGGTQIDCCGVCGGDGNSCLDKCKFYNLTTIRKKALKAQRALYRSVVKYSNQELKCTGGKSAKSKGRLTTANSIISTNTETLTKFVTGVVKICNTPYCTKRDISTTIETLDKNTKLLYKLSKKAQYGASAACKTIKKSAQGNSKSKSDYRNANSIIKGVPGEICTN